jgi:hypothetical protein
VLPRERQSKGGGGETVVARQRRWRCLVPRREVISSRKVKNKPIYDLGERMSRRKISR